MKPLVQSNRPISQTNNFKSQAAKRLIEIFVEKVILLIKRQAFHQVYLHSIREDSYDGIQEALDDTPGEAQRNLSFIEGSDARQFRTGLTTVQPTLIPQKSSKKLNQDQQDLERALALSLNRSFTKAPTYVKEQEGQGEKASEFNPSDLKWAQPNGGYDEDKKFKLDVFSVQTKSYVSSNLRIGDIIYFKSVIEYGSFKKNDKPYKMVGILSGDGIASNRLECVDRNVAGVTKNANFLFKRSLFRVEPSSKYYYQKLYQKMKDSDRESDSVLHEGKLSFLKKKYDEEKEENESEFRNQIGQPVLYGQLIHLKHLYSNCYLTLQPNALSLQYGCVKLTLEEQGSEMSNFKFMASGNLKSQEDVVTYSDPVHIVNNRGDYYMHVWDEAYPRNSVESGLEVNGAETSSNWKLLRFMDFEEYHEYENNTTFLESGDIVKLILKKTGATLSVPPKNLGPMISTRDIFINNEAEDNYGPQRTTVTTKIMESKIPALPIDLETPAKYTVSDLWEVQRRNAFVGGFARSDETFRLKNVSTGLFLCQDPRSERLELTPDGNREECYFLFRPKKNDDQRHRIEYSELLRIQTFNGSYLQQHRSKDPGDLCGPKVADSARILFHFKKSSYELSSAGNRLASLFPCFHNFHCFLQFWGLQQAAENIYDYNKAVESEKDLDIEIDNLKEGLENLEDFLKTSSNDLSFKFKQRVLIEQRIIDILILITELIETKTGGNRVRKEIKKLEGKLRGGEDWGYIEKSPQNIARKYLDKPVRQIYNILLLSTRDSIQVSRIIIKNSPFFTRQFAYYRKEAGNLLKEAFKNSAQLDEYDPHNEQLVRWVGELDMIKETENNLPLQTLYLEIISLACIDIRMKGVVKYQDKVLQEFFSPNSHFLKGLVTFTRRNNRVYVSFARKAEITKEEFLEVNPCLTLNEINYEEYEGKCFFSLQDLSIVKNKNVELIVDYLSAVLWLFYSLCKNRNQDGINHIKGIGLQSETLMSCMQDDLIHIKLKTGFILLYEALFIDVDPYKSIKDCSNHCYIWEEIEHKKLSEYTYLWHSLSNYNKVDWMKDYDKTKVNIINDYILDFWMNGKNIIRLEIASSHTIFSNSDSEYLQKANLIHAMLEFTKNAVNLGFTNTVTNNQILYAVTNLFAAFRNGQEKDKWAVWEVDSWISKFVQANPLSTRHEIFMQIYLEALEILEVMADLRISLQVAGFLKVFKICFENGASLDRDSFNAVFSLFFQKYGLNVPIPKLIENVDKSMSDLDLQPVRIPVVSGIMNSHLNEVVREIANPETNEVIKSGIIFINMLNELAEKDKFLEKQTRKVLKRFFDQRECLLDDLRRIEIISGKKEIEIYTEFDSQERLEIQINKVLQDDENLRQNYKIDLSSYKTRIIDINNSLNRMITRFKERKRDLKLTLKTQNIMRNLNIHISVLKILKLSYREQEHREVFKSAISVLYYFCKANADNQRELYPHIPDLLALVEKRLKPSKLIAQIFCRKKTDRECHYFIDIIFNHLASQDPLYYINHTEYLIILRSLLIDERKNAIHDNQRVIMSRLMKNKDFLSKLEFRIPEKTRVNDIKDEDIAILYYQAENVLLLANLCLESKLGMMQAKKAISYEELKGLLTNNTTPFIQKKAFLRCLFQIYVTNWADLNQEFDKKNMVEILSGVVLPDLKIFMNFLEGVIEIPSETTKVEKQRRAERLRETIAKYKSSHLEGRDEKALVGLVSMGKKLLPPIAGAGPENRKKLRDQSEYWEYLNSGKSWNLKQDGLLYFIIDCFYEIDQRGWTIDEGLKDVLGQIKSSLIRMNDVLLQIEEEISKEGAQIRLSKYTVLINECIDRLPDKKAGRKGKSIHMQADGLAYNLVQGGSRNNYDRKPEEKPKEEENLTEPSDPVSLILQKIKSFILKRKMTLEDFMALFRNVEDKMNIEEFRNKLKTFLGNTVKLSEIDEFIANIRKSKRGSHELDNTVSLSKVYKKLQKSFERDRAVNYKDLIKEEHGALLEDLNSPDSLNVLRSMKNFTNQYVEFNLNNEEANTELREVITALFSEPKKKITKKKLEEYEILLAKLLKIFNKKHYEIYLLRMLKYLLKNFEEMVSFEGNLEVNDSDSEDEDQEMHNYNAKDEFKKIQLVFAKSDALKLCLNSLKEGVPKKQVFEAVEVMNFMLKTGNKQVQKHILDILKKDPSMSGFFNYIKLQLWQTIDIFKKLRETEEISQPDSSAAAKGRIILPLPKNLEPETIMDLRIAENIIRMAQLFCENCFIDFQNFLRIQASSAKTTIVSTNLVNELSNFLVDLQLTDPNIFQNPRMFPLVSASLKALIDFCMGPCQENQKVLGSQRHLISFINSFLDKDINFQSSNDDDLQMIDTFSHVIKFLLALVNGNKSIQVKEFLLNQLSVDALIRKLVVIFTTKIANRDINIFRQERRCPQGRGGQHAHGCAENFCVINFLTPKDFLIIESAFNVYILLTIFTEEFNDNPKLEKFKYDRLNPEEKNRLYYLEGKHKSYFSDQNKKRLFNVSSDLLMQYSQTQLKKTQIHPGLEQQLSSKKFKFPMASLRADDDPVLSPDSSSMEALDPSSPHPLVKKKSTIRNASFLTPMEKYRNSVVKQLMNSPTDKNLMTLDRDLQKLQEEEMFKEFFSLKERYIVGKARRFFRPFINSVEVNQDGQLSKNYFQVPFECDYITENIREHLIFKATRDSDIERIEHLFYNIPLYRGELEHRQKMSRNRSIEWLVKRWRFFKDIAYVAVIASNIVMLASYDSTSERSDLSNALNKAFMIIQIALSAFVLLLCVYERWPIATFKKSALTTESSKKKNALKKTLAIEKNQTSPYILIARYFRERVDKISSEISNSRMSYGLIALNVLFDKENFYNILYLVLTIIAFALNPLVNCILLLDIVKRSKELRAIIKSITHNLKKLVMIILLGIIIMYFYAILGLENFHNDFEEVDINCDKLIYCWTSIINYGLRAAPGVGDILKGVDMSEHEYWGRWVYDLSFFILITIIFLYIILGIIIDTFAQLRDLQNNQLRKIEETCFICGLNKADFDTKGNGWHEHIYKEHNVYAYLNFSIYVEKKDMSECNGVEKYVKGLIEKKDINFVPQGIALALQE